MFIFPFLWQHVLLKNKCWVYPNQVNDYSSIILLFISSVTSMEMNVTFSINIYVCVFVYTCVYTYSLKKT